MKIKAIKYFGPCITLIVSFVLYAYPHLFRKWTFEFETESGYSVLRDGCAEVSDSMQYMMFINKVLEEHVQQWQRRDVFIGVAREGTAQKFSLQYKNMFDYNVLDCFSA